MTVNFGLLKVSLKNFTTTPPENPKLNPLLTLQGDNFPGYQRENGDFLQDTLGII